jgi:formate dehydrogenase iron-sulfur subunit
MNGNPHALLDDLTRCIGCRACVQACLDRQGFDRDAFDVEGLSASAFTVIEERGELYVRRLCMHCDTPSCASACPVAALHKTPEGPVVYDASRCLGCRYCIQACPFRVPRYEWDRPVPRVAKCDLCFDRLAQGRPTACTEACPVEATVCGPRDELLREAHRRIAESPQAYVPQVYGEHEVGGTSVLFLSPVSFASLGLPENLGDLPLPLLTKAALDRIPSVVTVGGALLLAIWWITKRREEVARAEASAALDLEAAEEPPRRLRGRNRP